MKYFNKYKARILYRGDIKLLEFKQGLDVTFSDSKPVMDTFKIYLKPCMANKQGQYIHEPAPSMTKIEYSIDKKVINFDSPLDWLKVYNEDFCIKNFGKSQISYKLVYDRRLMNIRYDTGIVDATSTLKLKY